LSPQALKRTDHDTEIGRNCPRVCANGSIDGKCCKPPAFAWWFGNSRGG
jgi:hypothetical protein